MPNKTFT